MGKMIENMTAEQALEVISKLVRSVSEFHGNLRLHGSDGPIHFGIEVTVKGKQNANNLWRLAGILREIQILAVRRSHYLFDEGEIGQS